MLLTLLACVLATLCLLCLQLAGARGGGLALGGRPVRARGLPAPYVWRERKKKNTSRAPTSLSPFCDPPRHFVCNHVASLRVLLCDLSATSMYSHSPAHARACARGLCQGLWHLSPRGALRLGHHEPLHARLAALEARRLAVHVSNSSKHHALHGAPSDKPATRDSWEVATRLQRL